MTWVNLFTNGRCISLHFLIDHISKRISCIRNVTECIFVIRLFTLVRDSLGVDEDVVAKAKAAAAVALLRLVAIVSASWLLVEHDAKQSML